MRLSNLLSDIGTFSSAICGESSLLLSDLQRCSWTLSHSHFHANKIKGFFLIFLREAEMDDIAKVNLFIYNKKWHFSCVPCFYYLTGRNIIYNLMNEFINLINYSQKYENQYFLMVMVLYIGQVFHCQLFST